MAEFSLGLVEVSALGNAINMLDEMVKVADVEFIAMERKLGGRLVTIVVKGSVSAVKASVDAGVAFARENDCLKAFQVIARPHREIFKFLNIKEEKVKSTAEVAGTHVGSVGGQTKKAPEEKKAPATKKASTTKKSTTSKRSTTKSTGAKN